MRTVESIYNDGRYDMACTFIVECMGEIADIYTRENKFRMLIVWGKEEATAHFLNTREVVIRIQ